MGLPLLARAQAEGKQDMAVPVVRVSLGTFDADKAAIVEAKLIESKAVLEFGIRTDALTRLAPLAFPDVSVTN